MALELRQLAANSGQEDKELKAALLEATDTINSLKMQLQIKDETIRALSQSDVALQNQINELAAASDNRRLTIENWLTQTVRSING